MDVEGRGDQSVEVGILRHVGLDEAGRAPEAPRYGLAMVRITVGKDNVGTGRDEDRPDRLADE